MENGSEGGVEGSDTDHDSDGCDAWYGRPCDVRWHTHLMSATDLALGYQPPDLPPEPSGEGDAASTRDWESNSDESSLREDTVPELTLDLDYPLEEAVTEVYFAELVRAHDALGTISRGFMLRRSETEGRWRRMGIYTVEPTDMIWMAGFMKGVLAVYVGDDVEVVVEQEEG